MAMTETVPQVPEWTVGDRLRKSRDNAGLKQSEMADLLCEAGLKASRSTVSAWEADENQPRGFRKVIYAWASITAVPAEWLFTGQGAQNAKLLFASSRPTSLTVVPGTGQPTTSISRPLVSIARIK